MELYSFDVFDTLITRTMASPHGIFAQMQRILCEKMDFAKLPVRLRESFFHVRVQGEAVARNTFINETVKDITLTQIYQCIKNVYAITDEQMKQLMELEIQTEYENSIPVSDNINRVKQLLDQKKRVVLITNMYLPQAVIRQLLVKADPAFAEIPLYVSGELGKTKGTWTLYHYVKQIENVEFTNWEHFGDNKELDVEIPQKLKIQAIWSKRPDYLPWEKDFLDGQEENLGLQRLIGASVQARIGQDNGYSYTVGAGYSGPLLYPYVEWVLLESMQRRINKLFFIARDGYILKKMADCIIANKGLAIETSYLYGSRKAWRLPSVTPENFDMEEFLLWNYPGQIFSYEDIAGLFEMSLQEFEDFLPFPVREGRILSASVRKEVFQILKENQKAIASFIYERQKGKREGVIAYLKQELGDIEDSFAFVDLIGSGYTQKCLSELLRERVPKGVTTFFYRLDSCRMYQTNRNYAFYANRLKMGNVIEVLCSANHGQTAGYRKKENRWEPVCETDEGEALDKYGFQDYTRGILAYTKYMALGRFWDDRVLMDLRIPGLYFDFIANAKDPRLYQYIADMPYGIRGSGKEVKCFAPVLSDRMLRQIYLLHKDEPFSLFYSGYSLEYSLLRLSEKQKKKLARYKRWSNTAIFKQIQNFTGIKRKEQRLDSKYDLIAERIILYGAGKRGRLLYRQLTEGSKYHAKIILWVDQNYEECRKNGLNVCGVEKISETTDYEQVVIAVLSEAQAVSIKAELLARGVPGYRVLWIQPHEL